MIDTSILKDTELLEKAREEKRNKSREYNKEWYRNFKKKHGIDYNTYLLMKKIKEGKQDGLQR